MNVKKIMGVAGIVSLSASGAYAQKPHQEPVVVPSILATPLNAGTDLEHATIGDIEAEIEAIEKSLETDEELFRERQRKAMSGRAGSGRTGLSPSEIAHLESMREARRTAKKARLEELRAKAGR